MDLRTQPCWDVIDPAIKPGGVLSTDPGLPDAWWATLSMSLGALASHTTTRIATPHTVPISQERVTATIESV
ncbi:MAG: hypothetical protein ACRDRS_24175, partial [Pseudonocardiaceae bacterium]